jgi:RNA polymerase I-specific transcription initiation factor RRN3
LRVFDAVILPTHKSKYTQFLLFFAASRRPAHLDEFVSLLVNKLFDARLDQLTRQSCAAYVASFLARASFVPTAAVRHVLVLLVRWLHEYVASPFGMAQPDAAAHGVFYSVVQAVLYIFCFHSRTILGQEDGREWFASLNLAPIVTCNLNPFKICFQVAVLEFVKITEAKELMTVGSAVLERNRRLILPKTAAGHSNILEAFFPFDPYLLRVSSAHLTGLYLEWQATVAAAATAAGEEDDDEGSSQPTERSSVASQGGTPAQTPNWHTISGGSLPDSDANAFSLGRAYTMDTTGTTPVAHSPSIPISETLGSSPAGVRTETYSMR